MEGSDARGFGEGRCIEERTCCWTKRNHWEVRGRSLLRGCSGSEILLPGQRHIFTAFASSSGSFVAFDLRQLDVVNLGLDQSKPIA